jgi:hypothetical protein
VIDYLAHADLAKFAKLHPEAARARADLDLAWEFVERTRFRDEESAAAGASNGAAHGGGVGGEAGRVVGGLDRDRGRDVDHSGGAGGPGETAPLDREEAP